MISLQMHFNSAFRLCIHVSPDPSHSTHAQDMDIGGYNVPKGTAVLTAQYSFHHNPEYWPEPDKFQPERCVPR